MTSHGQEAYDDRIRERIDREAEERRRLGLPEPAPWKPPNPDLDIWGRPKKKSGSRRKSKREFARWM